MAITLVGDIHGGFRFLANVAKETPLDVPIIQVGDFGFWPQIQRRYVVPENPVYFIDGNHDCIPALHGDVRFGKPVELWPHAVYVPRGTVLELAGKRVLFLGGATSVDRSLRAKDIGLNAWFEDEVLDERSVEIALENAKGKVDLMVTHTAPRYLIDKCFGFPRGWNLPVDWTDPSTERIERVWKALDCPPLVCGHMHASVRDGVVRMLDINETYTYE